MRRGYWRAAAIMSCFGRYSCFPELVMIPLIEQVIFREGLKKTAQERRQGHILSRTLSLCTRLHQPGRERVASSDLLRCIREKQNNLWLPVQYQSTPMAPSQLAG